MIILTHKDVLGLVEKILLLYGLATFPAFPVACKMYARALTGSL